MKDYHQPSFYRFNEDSIRLSKFIKRLRSQQKDQISNVLEVGAGCGVISCEVFKDLGDQTLGLTLVEKEREFENFINKNLKIYLDRPNLDLKIFFDDFLSKSLPLKESSFQMIFFNPPYFFTKEGRSSPNERKEACRRMERDDFKRWLHKSHELLIPGGHLYFCHRSHEWSPKEFKMVQVEGESSQGASYFLWQRPH